MLPILESQAAALAEIDSEAESTPLYHQLMAIGEASRHTVRTLCVSVCATECATACNCMAVQLHNHVCSLFPCVCVELHHCVLSWGDSIQ